MVDILRRALKLGGVITACALVLYFMDIGCIIRFVTGVACPGSNASMALRAALGFRGRPRLSSAVLARASRRACRGVLRADEPDGPGVLGSAACPSGVPCSGGGSVYCRVACPSTRSSGYEHAAGRCGASRCSAGYREHPLALVDACQFAAACRRGYDARCTRGPVTSRRVATG